MGREILFSFYIIFETQLVGMNSKQIRDVTIVRSQKIPGTQFVCNRDTHFNSIFYMFSFILNVAFDTLFEWIVNIYFLQ